MKIIAVLFVLAACASGGVSQEHAPTVDMCRADAALWYDLENSNKYRTDEVRLIRDNIPNRTEIAKLPITEVSARATEMMDCMAVDKINLRTYTDARDFYMDVLYERYLRFVHRHNLKDQLFREDAQGIR